MTLPSWNSDGLLPMGVHKATLTEVWARCVQGCPDEPARRRTYRALETYCEIAQFLIHGVEIWLGGGLVTNRPLPLAETKVAILPSVDQFSNVIARFPKSNEDRLHALATLRGVVVSDPPATLQRLLPISGELDGYLVEPRDQDLWIKRMARYGRGMEPCGYVAVTR